MREPKGQCKRRDEETFMNLGRFPRTCFVQSKPTLQPGRDSCEAKAPEGNLE